MKSMSILEMQMESLRNFFQDPILIGETADAAFVTRFRQVISLPDSPEPFHLLRVNYAANETLMTLVKSDTPWPGHQRSKFLVEAALKYLGRCHYIVHRDKVTDGLSQILADPSWGGPALRSKFWVLFALGELYVTKFTTNSTSYPGLEYFAQASKMLGILDERPGLDTIETLLLLSLYSLALNRRYNAYTLVGTAMRSAIVMGLHLDVPESQLPDPFARDHRKRLFWTAYMFDRMWGVHLNLPAAIQDDEIKVSLPSYNDTRRDPSCSADHAFLTASIKLVGRLTSVIGSVYSNRRSSKDVHLSTKVRRALGDLQNWVNELPKHLQPGESIEGKSDINVISLHLSFYQCVILTTRPILLHALRVRVAAARISTPSSAMHVPASASALSEACAKCARHSVRLLTQAWIDGIFVTFDCFFTRYLFSSLTILAVASMLDGKDNTADRESFGEAASLLRQLKDAGNCVAQEYCHHVEAMEAAISEYVRTTSSEMEMVGVQPAEAGFHQLLPGMVESMSHDLATAAGMPWTELSLQKLLSQPGLDTRFIEDAGRDEYSEGMFWPNNGD
ncbi:hypothetical protein LB504_012986 [Fusarium proliferatum]|nr:hypothetical protein LB504_012986 [Fusarium proliferatum]